jgi:hypothetical protein
MMRSIQVMMTVGLATSVLGCHYFLPTQPGIFASVTAAPGGIEVRFVNCSDRRQVEITRLAVRHRGPVPHLGEGDILCGVEWQRRGASILSTESWRYGEVPPGYTRLGECKPLPAANSFVIFGSPVNAGDFTLAPNGSVQAGPVCPE